jgi:hypothetical protein
MDIIILSIVAGVVLANWVGIILLLKKVKDNEELMFKIADVVIKKEMKELYNPKTKVVSEIQVPAMNFLMLADKKVTIILFKK